MLCGCETEKNGMEHGEAGWWKQQFDNADADKNGTLTFNEFKELLLFIFPYHQGQNFFNFF